MIRFLALILLISIPNLFIWIASITREKHIVSRRRAAIGVVIHIVVFFYILFYIQYLWYYSVDLPSISTFVKEVLIL